jgi:CDP-glycerol glycerophosphotransferase (TagB/SpsB family)
LRPGAHVREIDPAFFASDFAQNWLGLLQSSTLRDLCEEQGLTLGFLPHPVLQPALPAIDLPPHVRALSFAENDAQELFARAAAMVTDYSSMAFNAAYINRPLVYFQFDHDRVSSGEHLGRRGYFDYERDGFGPVTYTVGEAATAIADVIRSGRSPSPSYQARIDASFPLRDGRCCERVVNEIVGLTRRLTPAEAAVPADTPTMAPPLSAPSET